MTVPPSAPLPSAAPDPLRAPWIAPMRRALVEAARAPGTGDVPVGAVVLSADGTVLGTGHNEREATGDPTAHAEVLALRAAAETLRKEASRAGSLRAESGGGSGQGGGRRAGEWRLTGCTLVVTLEPCTMCAGAIVLSRVDRVVYGARDAKAGAVGSLWDVVRDRRLNHRPEVITGVLEPDCAALLTAFFRDR
ncbi:nucleoside deaminase [Streptomyces noursei]|uniref:nucleoside deaminase n=2 Tax=Streptomyces noursei TaxID=1971 RepID=UPI00081D1291|nr:nucleoside deaminase [Streptomyces noursei]ANZ17306.1 zinc-binding CMP/dCMP deaminase protein [Streptomyces noursei ATCC 11455]MCZ0994228.1 nucleoside deaminase [Streptomyces noursei]GGX10422.1 tRNA-specific adenosine deaminase [Streptomyces noursei]